MPPETNYNENELLRDIARGDEDSFRILFEQYQDKVYKVAIRYLKSHALAQEIVQDVFIKLWSKRAELPQVLYFTTWLHTLARNYIIDYMRRVAVQDAAQEEWAGGALPDDNSTDHKVRTAQYERLLAEAIGDLSPQQQIIYRMAKEKNLTYDEIGRELSLSPLTVKTHMQRALQSIREFFRKHGEIFVLLLLMRHH